MSDSESFSEQPEQQPSPYMPEITPGAEPIADEESQDIPAEPPESSGESGNAQQAPVRTISLQEKLEETNGGPLGCCLGVTIGLTASFLLGLVIFGNVTTNVLAALFPADPHTYVRIATGIFLAIGIILGGTIGWKIGKKIYREYEPPVVKERKRKRKALPKSARL